MDEEYWFITYSWQGDGERVLAHDVYNGPMFEWISAALEQPENWILLNQTRLAEIDFHRLQYAV